MSDVFVSYKAEDKRRVKPLIEALEADGYSVWWDEQIGGGASWRQSIEAELNAAKCVVVAWSKRSAGPQGAFVQDEATRAQQRQVYVPVLIDKVSLPLGFGETQALPLMGWKGGRSDARYVAVLDAVRRLAGANPASPGERDSRTHPGISRRAMVAGGAVAAVGVAGVGGWALLRPSPAAAADSIAVLPFANLSGDPAQAYFSDGLAEELRSVLARLASLKVVGRTSSEAVRDDDAETASKKLGIDNILVGSVRQSPSMIRISAQLVDGKNGIERWSQTYDRAPGDTIKIQTDIAENVARALSIALESATAASAIGGTKNAEAQRQLFRAMEAFSFDRKDIERATAFADAAIALDPNYAEAHAQKALLEIHYAASFTRSPKDMEDQRTVAMRSAETALRLAPELPSAHRAMAEIHRVGLNVTAAERAFRRAMELAPGDANSMMGYAALLGRLGKGDEALSFADKALSLDPLNPQTYPTRVFVLVTARRYAEALAFAQQVERDKPHFFKWPEAVAYALILQNKLEEATKYNARAPAESYNRLVNEAVLLFRTGRSAEVPRVIRALHDLYGESASYQYAEIYAQLGDRDKAFAALQRAWEFKDPGLMNLKFDPYMDPIREDARYQVLMRGMNFPA